MTNLMMMMVVVMYSFGLNSLGQNHVWKGDIAIIYGEGYSYNLFFHFHVVFPYIMDRIYSFYQLSFHLSYLTPFANKD